MLCLSSSVLSLGPCELLQGLGVPSAGGRGARGGQVQGEHLTWWGGAGRQWWALLAGGGGQRRGGRGTSWGNRGHPVKCPRPRANRMAFLMRLRRMRPHPENAPAGKRGVLLGGFGSTLVLSHYSTNHLPPIPGCGAPGGWFWGDATVAEPRGAGGGPTVETGRESHARPGEFQ